MPKPLIDLVAYDAAVASPDITETLLAARAAIERVALLAPPIAASPDAGMEDTQLKEHRQKFDENASTLVKDFEAWNEDTTAQRTDEIRAALAARYQALEHSHNMVREIERIKDARPPAEGGPVRGVLSYGDEVILKAIAALQRSVDTLVSR